MIFGLISACSSWRLTSLPYKYYANFVGNGVITHGRKQHLSAKTKDTCCEGFQPAPPPAFNGTPVFPDVDLNASASDEALKRNADADAVFVVSGSSRGIGVQYVKSLFHRTQGSVVACCRSPDDADNELNRFLSEVGDSSLLDRLTVLPLDLEKQRSIENLAEEMKSKFNRVDALFNVAGILGDGKATAGPERSLIRVDRDWVEKSLAVNVVGPVMLSKALAPLMKIDSRRERSEMNDVRATRVIVNMSARVGSISDNMLGGWYSYRFSKSALNQATRTMAYELKRQGIWAISLHPGTTDTNLSQPFQNNIKPGKLFPVDFTVKRMLNVVDRIGEEHSGGLYDWAGKALPF